MFYLENERSLCYVDVGKQIDSRNCKLVMKQNGYFVEKLRPD